MSGLPWFRLYSETIDDGKLKLLAFEDRWHFIAICCLKCSGDLDGKKEYRDRLVATKMGLSLSELDTVKKRLMDVDLVTEELQPVAWKKRQFKSDTSAERQAKYRKRKKSGDVTTPSPLRDGDGPDTDKDTETDTDKDKDKKQKEKTPRFDARSYLLSRGADGGLVKDWFAVRSKKKAANTETAMHGFLNEVRKANLPINEVLTLCCQNSWAGFKSSWETNDNKAGKISQEKIDELRKQFGRKL